jgi:hypothetical protein
MGEQTQATVLLLGAKSTENVLASIPDELSAIKHIFDSQQQDGLPFKLEYEPYLTRQLLTQQLEKLTNQVAIMHFAGHSDKESLQTDDELVYSRHIANILKTWTIPPSLIFLNGCHNADQVQQFHNAGIAIVIATHRLIDDQQASQFAREFYRSLFSQKAQVTLQNAFDRAGGKVFMGQATEPRSFDLGNLEQADDNSQWDWGLFSQNPDYSNQWTLHDLLENNRPVFTEEGELLNPYKGLEAFQETDVRWFFGRELISREISEQILNTRFFTLLGASGSGKSSLINAGVVPQLRHNDGNEILQLRLGSLPFAELAKVFARAVYSDSVSKQLEEQDHLAHSLQEHNIQLATLVNEALRKIGSKKIFLIIDQFEELFTQSQYQLIQKFLLQLIELIKSDVPCTLILIMRADFLASVLSNPEFSELIDAYPHKLLSPMTKAELRAAIEKPANKQHVELEDALIDVLLDAGGRESGSLPILQYVLSLLWDKRKAHRILLDDYNRLGGVEKALETRADAIFKKFTASEQAKGKDIFLRLIQLGEGTEDTRRRAARSEFKNTSEIQNIIQELASERLITTKSEGKDQEGYIEVAHEALIRSWPRLRSWIDENRDILRIKSRFTEAANVWSREGRNSPQDYVYRGALLASIEELINNTNENLNDIEKEFFEASLNIRNKQQREEQKRKERELEQTKALLNEQTESAKRQRRLFIASGIFLLLLSVVIVFSFNYFKQAKKFEEVRKQQEYERNRTDIEGDLTVFGSYYNSVDSLEVIINDEHRGAFTHTLENNLFESEVSVSDAVIKTVEKIQSISKQRPELSMSLNGDIFFNPVNKQRNFFSLVFGWDYSSNEFLRSQQGTLNDAKSIHEKVQGLGYTSELFINADQEGFSAALKSLEKSIDNTCGKYSLENISKKPCKNTVVFLYFAGYGLSQGGDTYIIPSDYLVKTNKLIQLESVERIRKNLSKKVAVRIIIADTSRLDADLFKGLLTKNPSPSR